MARPTPAALLLASLVLAGCPAREQAPEPLPPTRGVVLVSLDALRPDHLGAYGYRRDTSPALDALAARGAVFEHAVAQYPSTLASHLALFTGLYPQEHGVYRPETVLSAAIPTLPERLRAAGVRTAGHTEGGFMQGGYGFRRGFEAFTDTAYTGDTDVERTFARGVEFLESLAPDDRFFLFLHTYSIHDPYTPPEPYRDMFWDGPPPAGAIATDGQTLRAVNRGEIEVTPEVVEWLVARYDASIRYVDERLGELLGELDRLGLTGETAVIVTSDHGEAFLEHGKLAHVQVYPEDLLVPLIVAHPGLDGPRRIAALVELLDVGQTVYSLLGLEPPGDVSGRSLAALLAGAAPDGAREAYGENLDRDTMYALFRQDEEGLHQLVHFEPLADPGGTWVSESVRFFPDRAALAFEAQGFHEPRRVRVVDGETEIHAFDTTPGWRPVRFEIPPESRGRELVLATSGCASPHELGVGDDTRCLSFQVRGLKLARNELYDLAADRLAQRDLARQRSRLLRRLLTRLAEYRFTPRADAGARELSEETREQLEAMGYLGGGK